MSLDDSIIQELEECAKNPIIDYKFEVPPEYNFEEQPEIDKSKANTKTVTHYVGDVVDVLSYSNTLTRLFPDGYRVCYFNNGDIKLYEIEGRTVLFKADSKTVEIVNQAEGYKEFIFKFGQYEKYFKSGTKFISYKSGAFKLFRSTRDELTRTTDDKYVKRSRFGKISLLSI